MNQLILCSGESKASLFTASLTLQILGYFTFSKKQLRASGMTFFFNDVWSSNLVYLLIFVIITEFFCLTPMHIWSLTSLCHILHVLFSIWKKIEKPVLVIWRKETKIKIQLNSGKFVSIYFSTKCHIYLDGSTLKVKNKNIDILALFFVAHKVYLLFLRNSYFWTYKYLYFFIYQAVNVISSTACQMTWILTRLPWAFFLLRMKCLLLFLLLSYYTIYNCYLVLYYYYFIVVLLWGPAMKI